MKLITSLFALSIALYGQLTAPILLNNNPPTWMVDGALGSTIFASHGAAASRSAYRNGKLYTIRRDSDSATLDVFGNPWAPDRSTIISWLNGATGFVTTAYDQTGHARNCAQATTSAQPALSVSSPLPVFAFDGLTYSLDCTSALSAFGQNSSGNTLAAVRQATSTASSNRQLLFVSTNSGGTRMSLGPSTAAGKDVVGGRRLDADSFAALTGFAQDTSWHVDIGRWDYAASKLYYSRDQSSDSLDPFETAGSTSNTASTSVAIGRAVWNGFLSLAVWQNSKISDAATTLMIAGLRGLAVTDPSQFLSWGSTALTGTYTLAPGLTNCTTLPPNGSAPTQGDLDSHRFRHEAKVAIQGSRIWLMWVASGTNEDAGGQMVIAASSTDSCSTWSSLVQVVPPQSTWAASGAADEIGTRMTSTRGIFSYAGNLYLVSTIDSQGGPTGTFNPTGLAVVAAQANTDGTVGALFRISTPAYTPVLGFPAIDYDADPTRAASLLAQAILYGPNGGSLPSNPATTWDAYATQEANIFFEPTTIPLDGTPTNMVRLWRLFSGPSSLAAHRKWSQLSTDGGATWTARIGMTNIPDSNANSAGLRLSDGRILFSGNPIDVTVSRDPLYLALFSGTTGLIQSVYAVRQGLSGTPTYPGTFKGGGAQYPSIASDGTNLWIAYSMQKETIGVTKIPIAGL